MDDQDREVRPLVGLTMGDVAGVGPEVIARAWCDPALHTLCRPMVIGDPGVLRRALELVGGAGSMGVQVVDVPEAVDASPTTIPCLPIVGDYGDLTRVEPGTVDPRAGAPPTSS